MLVSFLLLYLTQVPDHLPVLIRLPSSHQLCQLEITSSQPQEQSEAKPHLNGRAKVLSTGRHRLAEPILLVTVRDLR